MKILLKRSGYVLMSIAILCLAFNLPVVAATITAPVTVASGDYPVRINAPSIKLSAPIQGVGTTANGAMAVPSGKSNIVGWYKYGTIPGVSGTAVLDAHVFAAFKTLAKVKVGGDIYITMHSGRSLHFVVTKARFYSLSSLPSSTLFASTNAKQINLITCAGQLTADHTTYNQRLIVSAELV